MNSSDQLKALLKIPNPSLFEYIKSIIKYVDECKTNIEYQEIKINSSKLRRIIPHGLKSDIQFIQDHSVDITSMSISTSRNNSFPSIISIVYAGDYNRRINTEEQNRLKGLLYAKLYNLSK